MPIFHKQTKTAPLALYSLSQVLSGLFSLLKINSLLQQKYKETESINTNSVLSILLDSAPQSLSLVFTQISSPIFFLPLGTNLSLLSLQSTVRSYSCLCFFFHRRKNSCVCGSRISSFIELLWRRKKYNSFYFLKYKKMWVEMYDWNYKYALHFKFIYIKAACIKSQLLEML